MRIIGDVHGEYAKYIPIINGCLDSVQVGDMGFDYKPIEGLYERHKFIGGNHDNYDTISNQPNYLGDYGIYKDIGFVRGAKSTDIQWRTLGIDYWREEELSYTQSIDCMNWYTHAKPEIMITHDCPLVICSDMGLEPIRSNTQQLLQNLYDIHQPKLWIFGHYHISKYGKIGMTKYRCLNSLEYLDL